MTFDLDLENLHLDIDASNVVGLGASVVACDIINSINDSPYFSINNIPTPTSLCHYSSDLPTNVALHFSKSILLGVYNVFSLFCPPKFLLLSNAPPRIR